MKYISETEILLLMKSAMSLDGKIATYLGESKWISGEESEKMSINLEMIFRYYGWSRNCNKG